MPDAVVTPDPQMRPGMLEAGGGMMGLECPLDPPPGHNAHPHQAHSLVSHTPSISSGASTAGGGRVRFIRLIRRRNESYGFSLRGGLEHGTGFFISHVEVGSEAFMQGLRAGDQLLRVNNLSVEQAIHREVTAMVQSKSSVILKVKSAGIIPVKEHRGDPLTWLVIDDDEEEIEEEAEDEELETDFSDPVADSYSQSIPSSSSGASQHHHHHHHHHQPHHHHQHHHGGAASSSSNSSSSAAANDCHARVVIACGGKAGLGCSICKGPAEKPGIFVQSVRAGGVAKTAGLRPGDQILACNDISFTHLEFAEAVYVLKSSPRLVLDVLRGAGLDFVAGESSGYNSSASSVAGDQTPPSSSSDPRDSDHSVTSRLSAVSRHLTLDRSRGWREIEAEWADAELAEKRRQLQSAQRNLKTRAQRDANHRLSASGSRSLCNLSAALREEDDNEQCTAFRDAGFAYTHAAPSTPHLPPPTLCKTALRSTRSSSDVTDDTSHKIALVTSADPHVNNIVVTGGPKDERDAVSRLEQLSSPSASRTSTLSSGTSQVTVRSSSGSMASASASSKSCVPPPEHRQESVVEQQLRELREEQKRLKEEADRLAEERRKFEEERRRGIERTQSAPLAPLVINCPGQTSLPPSLLQSPPSPTSSISSGRHTTRVIIKSPPPPPPPRKNTTTLSSRPNHSHQHHLQQQQQRVSPPASPAHSSSSSSGVGSLCGSGAPPRRCKSIGSLSASSSESTVWEDLPASSNHSNHLSHNHHQNHNSLLNHQHHLNHQQLSASVSSNNININSSNNSNIPPDCTFRSNMPPPPPPKPSAPLTSSSQGNTNEPQTTMLGGVPPPPPPPPPQPASSNHQSSLAAALSRELERRNAQEAQSSVNGEGDDEVKAKVIQDKIEAFKKDKQKTIANDPKRAQHDKLMEEFKLAHKRMFVAKADSAEDVDEKPLAKLPGHQKLSRAPTNNLPVNSKIIERLKQNMPVNKIASNAVSSGNSSSIGNGKVATAVNGKSSHIVIDGTTSVNKWKEMLNSVPAANGKVNPPPASTTKESQQNEWSGGTTSKPSVLTKPPLRPTPGNTVIMEEFRPGEKQSPRVSPPSSYFEVQKESPAKPLVSIGTYPSPNNRPAPVKMDFLPSTSGVNAEVNGTTKQSNSPRDKLQSELTSTLTRSNIRQRLIAQELPLDPISSSTSSSISESSSTPNKGISATFTTTTIQNNSMSPGASLSNKYRGIGQDAPSVNNSEGGSRKECDESESLPTGILKASGPATSIRPLQKSISFGDVTTVGEDNWT